MFEHKSSPALRATKGNQIKGENSSSADAWLHWRRRVAGLKVPILGLGPRLGLLATWEADEEGSPPRPGGTPKLQGRMEFPVRPPRRPSSLCPQGRQPPQRGRRAQHMAPHDQSPPWLLSHLRGQKQWSLLLHINRVVRAWLAPGPVASPASVTSTQGPGCSQETRASLWGQCALSPHSEQG